jgi:hypothetical protein
MLRQDVPTELIPADPGIAPEPLVVRLSEVGNSDIARVGGKNASLGELVRNLSELHIAVPEGFATTAWAYWHFVEENRLKEKIASQIVRLKSGKANFLLPAPLFVNSSCPERSQKT